MVSGVLMSLRINSLSACFRFRKSPSRSIIVFERMASSSVVPQPWIAFGTGTALYGRDAADQVKVAIDSGFRHLDGAQSYSNEESLGKGITLSGVPREKLYITTKLGGLQEGETVKQSLEKSLAKLGVEQVDLFLVHSPGNHKGNLSKVWDGMVEVKQLGLTKRCTVLLFFQLKSDLTLRHSIGVSNFSISNLKEITQGRDETDYPVLNQVIIRRSGWQLSAYSIICRLSITPTCSKAKQVYWSSTPRRTLSLLRMAGSPPSSVKLVAPSTLSLLKSVNGLERSTGRGA